jgi:hypothetical protein
MFLVITQGLKAIFERFIVPVKNARFLPESEALLLFFVAPQAAAPHATAVAKFLSNSLPLKPSSAVVQEN